jgi:hypothetical protein
MNEGDERMEETNQQRWSQFLSLLKGQVNNIVDSGYDLQAMGFSIRAKDDDNRPFEINVEIDWRETEQS